MSISSDLYWSLKRDSLLLFLKDYKLLLRLREEVGFILDRSGVSCIVELSCVCTLMLGRSRFEMLRIELFFSRGNKLIYFSSRL